MSTGRWLGPVERAKHPIEHPGMSCLARPALLDRPREHVTLCAGFPCIKKSQLEKRRKKKNLVFGRNIQFVYVAFNFFISFLMPTFGPKMGHNHFSMVFQHDLDLSTYHVALWSMLELKNLQVAEWTNTKTWRCLQCYVVFGS